jgi:hypothetical protein
MRQSALIDKTCQVEKLMAITSADSFDTPNMAGSTPRRTAIDSADYGQRWGRGRRRASARIRETVVYATGHRQWATE